MNLSYNVNAYRRVLSAISLRGVREIKSIFLSWILKAV
jgi:hypothetical protein